MGSGRAADSFSGACGKQASYLFSSVPTVVHKKATGSPGARVFSDAAWDELFERLRLSPREGEILKGVFDDKTEFTIAAEIRISPHTVHTHVERLHQKLGVTDRVQLVLCVVQEFLRLQDSIYARQILATAANYSSLRCLQISVPTPNTSPD